LIKEAERARGVLNMQQPKVLVQASAGVWQCGNGPLSIA